jgi:radical SAM superfamily enzyme YgiQ (UPF0313 family)
MAPVQYDLIIDNPWEHPEELKDTLRLVASLKPPYTFAINSLTLLPGTRIYEMGEKAGFTDPSEKITLASYVTYRPTELNLTLAFYNITAVPRFWVKRVLAKDYGDRTITMPQYPRIGAIIIWAGMVKKLLHSLLRRDISPFPRPMDLAFGRWFVRPKGRKDGNYSIPREYTHCLPQVSARAARAAAQEALRVLQ